MKVKQEFITFLFNFMFFFFQVNTSSCIGVFKEIMFDNRLFGEKLPKNIFYVAVKLSF